MEPTRSQLGGVLLVLVALLGCVPAAGRVGTQDDARSRCSIFSVSASGPLWCEFQGMINRNPVFKYFCKSQKVKPIDHLGIVLNATEAWNQQSEHCRDLVEELRKALLDNQQNISKAFHSLSLQVHMICQRESNGYPSWFCQFDFNGKICLRFELKNKSWIELHPGCRSLKETLESDRSVANLFALVLNGDFVKLLNQSTAQHTKAAPATASATATAPAPAPAKTVNISPGIIIVSIVIPIFVLITLGCICYKYGEAAAQKLRRVWSSSTRVPSVRPPFHHLQLPTCDHQELQSLQPPGDCGATADATFMLCTPWK